MASNSYFSHDSNARNSKKMLRMRARLGDRAAAAYGVYWMLVERLREEESYVCEKDYEMLAFDLRVDPELIRTVVEDFGLFDISGDGRTFSSHGLHERMEEAAEKHAAKSSAGKKGAQSRWGDKNPQEMAQDGTSMAEPKQADGNKNKIKENKENYFSFSLSPSPDGEGAEEEKEKIISFFTFQRNWASPSKEYDKLIAYNNRPGVKKQWPRLSREEKASAVMLWQQKPPKARFDAPFLEMWRKVYQILIDGGAPTDIRMAALDDTVSLSCDGKNLKLTIPKLLRSWIEERIDDFRPTIWRFIKQQGCTKLVYKELL